MMQIGVRSCRLIFVGIALLLVVLWFAGRILLLAFAGTLIGLFLRALADFLRRYTRLTYGWALVFVLVLIGAVLTGFGWTAGSALAAQFGQFAEQLPQALENLGSRIEQSPWGSYLWTSPTDVPTLATSPRTVSRLTLFASQTMNGMAALVVTVFVGLYVAGEPQLYYHGILHLVPKQHRPRAEETLEALEYNLRWWIFARLITMGIIGILSGLGLWFIGIPLAAPLALTAAIFELVPNLGPLLASVPAILIAFTQGPQQAIYVALWYLVVQSLESYVVSPLLDRSIVRLPPALILMSVVLLGTLAGVLGLLVAAPLTLTILLLVKMLYVQDYLQDTSVEVPRPS